jgi:transcriptional regulator with XRE-family HTH domain
MAKKKTRRPVTKKKPAAPSGKKAQKRRRSWSLLTFEDLEKWREREGLPKKRAAEKLGVTNSTYHNWARGIAIPNTNTQKKLRETIDAPPQGPDGLPIGPSDETMRALAGIVTTYLQSSPSKVSPDDLPRLVRHVRQALGG